MVHNLECQRNDVYVSKKLGGGQKIRWRQFGGSQRGFASLKVGGLILTLNRSQPHRLFIMQTKSSLSHPT